MKKIIGVIIILVAACAGWYLLTDGTMSLKGAREKIVREAQDAVLNAANPQDVAALAMKTINMTQGEHGSELWRLKADWGNMRRDAEVMELEKPRFTYYMPPDNVEVSIHSDTGEIQEKDQIVHFIGNVVAQYSGRTVRAARMTFMGKVKEVVCPEGADITGAGLDGKANRVVWKLNEEILEGFGDVDMIFTNEKDVPAPGGKENAVPRRENAQG